MMKVHVAFLLCFLTMFTPKAYAVAEKITVCRPNGSVSVLGYIADHQKFFEEEGLSVTFNTATSGKICIDQISANKADFAFASEAPITHIAFSNPDLRIIAQSALLGDVALFGRIDKEIHKEKDIKSKTIGYLPGTSSYFYLVRLLDANNLTFEDLKAFHFSRRPCRKRC